jgi:hypothetical protein
MKRILGFITMVYGMVVRLFPSEFQEEFGDEIQGVFATMVKAAAGRSKSALAVACLQELRDFPVFLFRTHLEKGHMKKFFRSQPVRFAWRGALGFGLGLVLANVLLLCFYYWFSPAPSTVANTFWIEKLSILAGIGTAAVVGGLLFALLFSERAHFGWYALVGILGWFISQATIYTLSMSFEPNFLENYQISILVNAIFALEGALLSMIFCVAKSGRRKLVWPLAAGAILYPLVSYYFPQSLLYSYRFQPLLKIHPSWFFITMIVLVVVLLAGVVWVAIKSGGKALWVVLAGAAGYLFVFRLCDAIITRFHLFIPSPAAHNGLAAIDVVNIGIQPIMTGIIFGVILGLLLGWERKEAQQTGAH